MDQDLIAYLDERFGENAKQIDTLRQEMSGRFEVVEGAIRQTHVAVEGLRGDIQLLAEGIIGMEEKAQSFRNEATSQFEEVRKSIEPYFRQLDRRVVLLEDRAAREGQAPLDIIRERFGKKAG
jgi:predicted  nucleic acid-binding Zn-ribbon protein